MAEQGIIDNIVSKKAIDEVASLNKSLLETLSTIEKIVASNISNPTKKPSDEQQKSLEKVYQLEMKIQDVQTKRMQATLKEIEAQKQKEITLSAQLNQSQTKEAANIAALNAAKRESARIVKLQVQLNTSASGSFNALSAQYSLNTIELNKYSQAQIESSARLKKMQVDTEGLKNSMKLLKEATGDNTLNVGNYRSALAGTSKTMNNAYNSTFQMTQVMRELPNFAIDARIGFMSLSNNLPMLADGFKSVANSVDAMGNKMGNMGALKVFAKSLLSLNTVMIVAVTLMTLFGDKIIDAISKTSAATKINDAFNKSIEDGTAAHISAIEKIEKAKIALDLYSNGTISSADALNIYNKEAGDAVGSTNDIGVAITNIQKLGPSYIEFTKLMAQANLYLSESAKLAAKEDKIRADKTISNMDYLTSGFVSSFEFLKDYIKKPFVSADTYWSLFYKMTDPTKAIQDRQKFSAMMTGAESVNMEKQAAILTEKALQLAKNAGLDKVVGNDGAAGASKVIIEQYQKQIESLNVLSLRSKEWVDVVKEVSNENEDSAKSFAKLQTEIETIDYGDTVLKLDAQYKQDTDNLANKYNSDIAANKGNKANLKTINENYIAESKDLTEKFNNDMLINDLEYSDKLKNINIKLQEDLLSIKKDGDAKLKTEHETNLKGITDAINKSNDDYDKYAQIRAKAEEDLLKEKEQTKRDILKESLNVMDDLVNGFTDRYLDNLDKQREALQVAEDGKLTKIKEANEAGALSDEDYADKQIAIQNYTRAEQDKIDAKQKEAERAAFLTRQAIAVADIAIATAANIAKFPALAPFYLTLAGVQTAAVLAQTIPYFEHGGTTDKAGNIIVNEKRKELIVEPNGYAYIPQTDSATMINVPKGTKIYPDAARINNDTITQMVMLNSVQSGVDLSELRKDLAKLTKEVVNLRQPVKRDTSLMDKLKFARNYKLN